ncbi:RNA-binding S4 domain-containing protein [Candidatus Woesearchaeota archaeon]|nr:RNA-binding S4 domain-containing protein [Candidatus Woesearchaeota archaeon]
MQGDREHIELNAFLKTRGIVPTGGQAKLLIRSGGVRVNGKVETRNKRKLRRGDRVDVGDVHLPVVLG